MTDDGPRVAVAGWIGSTNLGDELIFAAIRRKLDQKGVACLALSIDPAATLTRHSCAAIAHRGPRDMVNLWRELRTTSSLVFGGGGLLQTETSPWNLPFHLSRVWSAHVRGLPWAGIGLGVGHLRSAAARAMVRHTLPSSVGLTVRDPGSAATLRSLGVNDIVIAADPVVSLERSRQASRDRIAVSLRRANTRGYRTAKSRATTTDEAWLSAVASALDALSQATGLSIHFVALQSDRDSPLHGAVAQRMSADCTFGNTDADVVLEEISTSQLVVAMRYHAAIGSLIAGRPCVVLDYSPKMRFLVADVGDGMQLADADHVDGGSLIEAMRRARSGMATLEPALARLRDREKRNSQMLDRLLELS